ncbi:DUF1364 domain-containing protein [Vreelandella andesensis]|uniref:DUF1364 domain-containing protein n=1 Tax=Vreelandella andesensis TaxID=447567 RepID=A0A433KEZ9_9GAMM|nr:nuclease domain-containing protein [Halomonas andesensis]RUR26823.1 DUF1364 domain-containing protein [Halomonas andesensis]
MLKATRIESKHVRQAAKGEHCTLQIVGACSGGTETTVLAHLPDESHGMSRKADDLSAAFCCSACHDVLDGRRRWPESEDRADVKQFYMRRAQTRTLRRLVELGVVTIKGVKL